MRLLKAIASHLLRRYFLYCEESIGASFCIAMNVSERVCKLLPCRYIRHEIKFQVQHNGTAIICRKTLDDATVRDN